MTLIFDASPYGRFIEIERATSGEKKFHRATQGSNFLKGGISNSNRDNVRDPIQFESESQP